MASRWSSLLSLGVFLVVHKGHPGGPVVSSEWSRGVILGGGG